MAAIFPPLDPPRGPDRLPKQDPAAYDAEQREAAEALIASPRGEVRGPFVPMMRSPRMMDRVQKLGEFLRYDCSVPKRLREWAILVAARHWSQPYEWHAHAAHAYDAGIPTASISALRDGERPDAMLEDEAVVFDFCLTLHRDHGVDDALYARALALLGERGLVELTGICGYYAMLAMVLNVARTPSPTCFDLPG